ncbi:MAG: protein kinase [Muribaculaceae bacterium]|nr:protein kinase [Muribaculaceae bacterium]
MRNSEFEREGTEGSGMLRLTRLERASGGTCIAYVSRIAGKKVFVKEIKPELAEDARMLAAFKKEAEIGFRLDHPNLPKYIFAEGLLPAGRYIVQEFIDGETLPDFIRANPAYFQSKGNVERFLREFVDVIDYLHHNQVVHLDLKPENVIISRVGTTLKLVDLGFCASDFYDDTRGFTPGLLPPETDPDERGAESDYFGLGRILAYIRSETTGFPKRRFKRIERRLLLPAHEGRLASKEELERLLRSRASSRGAWIAAILLLAVLGVGVYFIVNQRGAELPAEEPAEEPIPTDIQESETGLLPADEPTPEPSVEPATSSRQPDATPAASAAPSTPPSPTPATASTSFSYEAYEQLKGEMMADINKNFSGFERMLGSYIQKERFSQEDSKAVSRSYQEAYRKLFDTAPYKAKYTELSPSLIDDTMGELLQAEEKKRWGPVFERYMRLCQEAESGSSK